MNVLTVDLEDWFHLIDIGDLNRFEDWNSLESRLDLILRKILNLFAANKRTATFFVLGWVAETYPHLIELILEQGHEVGSHSYAHLPLTSHDQNSFEEDLERSIYFIQKVSGQCPIYYRAPGFSVMKNNCVWFFDSLMKYGFVADSSIFPIAGSHGGMPNFGFNDVFEVRSNKGSILELPMSSVKTLNFNLVVSGGGYFRLLPRHMIYKFMSSSAYNMIYLHPRDIDPDQPRIRGLGLKRHFKAYVGLRTAFSKLQFLLENTQTYSVGQALSSENFRNERFVYMGNP